MAARTVAVTRVIYPGKEREFARWADEVDRAVGGFDGHLGGVRLHDGKGVNHLVYHFDSDEHLRAWEESPLRRELLAKGDEISDEHRATAEGVQTWVDLPGESRRQRGKTFALTWLAAYPTLMVVSTLVRWLLPGLPQFLSLAISSLALTALLTWLILPRLTSRVRPWLLRDQEPDPT